MYVCERRPELRVVAVLSRFCVLQSYRGSATWLLSILLSCDLLAC